MKAPVSTNVLSLSPLSRWRRLHSLRQAFTGDAHDLVTIHVWHLEIRHDGVE